MVWEWSHSQEGIDNVRFNIRNMDAEDLKGCLCNNLTYKKVLFLENIDRLLDGEELIEYPVYPGNYFDETIYNEFLKSEKVCTLVKNHKISMEQFTDLSELIFKFASEIKECTNGGHYAYLDPYHDYAVPFSSIEEESIVSGVDVHSIDTSR